MSLAMAIEADLRDYVLRFVVLKKLDPQGSGSALQNFSNMREAWQMTLTEMGIDRATMASAGPPPSPIFGLIEDLVPEPNLKQSKVLSVEMLAYVNLNGV